ncbi:hypothetical protein QJS66_10960 [Kocuria rhizophila]|nr:hypothetical protein QJS66_10960 [Kocuria rhizophila]
MDLARARGFAQPAGPSRSKAVPAEPLGADEVDPRAPVSRGAAWVWPPSGGGAVVVTCCGAEAAPPRRPVDDAAHTALGQLDLTSAARAVLEQAAVAVDTGDAAGTAVPPGPCACAAPWPDAAETVIRVVSAPRVPVRSPGIRRTSAGVESLQVIPPGPRRRGHRRAGAHPAGAAAEDSARVDDAATTGPPPTSPRGRPARPPRAGIGRPGLSPARRAAPEDTPW